MFARSFAVSHFQYNEIKIPLRFVREPLDLFQPCVAIRCGSISKNVVYTGSLMMDVLLALIPHVSLQYADEPKVESCGQCTDGLRTSIRDCSPQLIIELWVTTCAYQRAGLAATTKPWKLAHIARGQLTAVTFKLFVYGVTEILVSIIGCCIPTY